MSAGRWQNARGAIVPLSEIWGVALLCWALVDWVGYSRFFVEIYSDDPTPAKLGSFHWSSHAPQYAVRDLWFGWLAQALKGGPTRVAVPLFAVLVLIGPTLLLGALAWRERTWKMAIGFTAFLGCVASALAIAHVAEGRRRCFAAFMDASLDPLTRSIEQTFAALQASATQCLVCVTALLVVPVALGAATVRRRLLEKGVGRGSLVVTVASATVVLLVGIASFASIGCLGAPLEHWHSHMMREEQVADFLESFWWLSVARNGIATFAIGGTAMVLTAAASDAQGGGHRDGNESIGIACLVVGGALCLLSRPMAYDAAHPLPAWVRSDLPNIEVSLPERDSCAPLRDTPMPDAPLVELRSDEARLDTIVLGPLATSAKDFAKALLGKRERRTATFGRVRRFMGPIVFAVERNLPMSVVVPYLEAARSASYPEVDVWVTKPARRFASRTHGTFVEPRPICRLTHRLDRPLPTSDTWNDWTERLETPSVQAKSN